MTSTMSIPAGCPAPISNHPRVLMAHGGGGRLMRQLIEGVFLPAFGVPTGTPLHDGAVLQLPAGAGPARLAFTTDSYVVKPLFFPGGDIGTLAVNGTVNDLAMCGARPLALSAGFILEEGFPLPELRRVAASMGEAARAVGVPLVTGDTKVVDRGKGDGVFVNTAGVGIVEQASAIGPEQVREGDRVIVSGDLGRHGIAIMAAREGFELESCIESDCAPLWSPVQALLQAGIAVRCLRDLTRGGLGAALVEIAESAGLRLEIDERAIPVRGDVAAACEMLGLDPLYVANEGRFVAFVPEADTEPTLAILAKLAPGGAPALIGAVAPDREGLVVMRTLLGSSRIVDLPSGEQLPRIC
jgi:hydrogenase expression/formation protein HypE